MEEKTLIQTICLTLGTLLISVELIAGLFIGLTYLNLDEGLINTLSWIILIFGVNVLLAIMIYVGLRKNE